MSKNKKNNSDQNLVALHVQYPFCDIRKLLINEKEHVKPLPDWGLPQYNRHFLQNFGHVKRRKKGGHKYFSNEIFFVEGKGGFKYNELEKVTIEEVKDFKGIYRRLGADGQAGVRYEFGLSFQDNGRLKRINESFYQEFEAFVEDIFSKVHLKIRQETEYINTSIPKATKYLSHLYNKSTLIEGDDFFDDDLLSSGDMCMLFEMDDSLFQMPEELKENALILGNGIQLAIYRLNVHNKEIGAFFLLRNEQSDKRTVRSIRLSIMRLFFEHQNLSQLLRMVKNPKNKFDIELLDKYISSKLKYIQKRTNKSASVAEVHHYIYSYFDLISPEETNMLVEELNKIRLQNRNKIWKFISNANVAFDSRFNNEAKKEVRNLIAKSDIKGAITCLEKYTTLPNLLDEVIILKSRFVKLDSDIMKGIVGYDQGSIMTNQIIVALLALSNKILE